MSWLVREDGDGGRRRHAVVVVPGGVWVSYPGGAAFVADAEPARVPTARLGEAAAAAAEAAVTAVAPMAGRIVQVLVAAGAEVAAGDTLVVVEAMKMEVPVRAPRATTVTAMHCAVADQVGLDAVLCTFAPPA